MHFEMCENNKSIEQYLSKIEDTKNKHLSVNIFLHFYASRNCWEFSVNMYYIVRIGLDIFTWR